MASCNERECNRVKLVNLGSQALRQHVPRGGARKKLSKVKTLRSAVEYIRAQQRLLVKRDAVRAHRACQGAANIGHSTLGCPRASRCLPRQCLAVLRLFIPRPQGQLGASSEDSGCKGELSPMQRELLDFSSLLGGY